MTELNGILLAIKSGQSKYASLLDTEDERSLEVLCAQDAFWVMKIVEPMKLKVKEPIKLFIDDKGAVDLENNWSVGGRARYCEIKDNFWDN